MADKQASTCEQICAARNGQHTAKLYCGPASAETGFAFQGGHHRIRLGQILL